MAEEKKDAPETVEEPKKVEKAQPTAKVEKPNQEKVAEKKETKSESGEKKEKKRKSKVVIEDASPGQVVKVFRKVGLYGECYQVLVRVLEGRDKGNLLRRNVRGPVKENDMLMLKETERDVRAV